MFPLAALPIGTVTFLFTDIEGSTRLWETYPEAMRTALARHETLIAHAIQQHGGFVFKTVGDAFCAAFGVANDALEAALAAQEALTAEPLGLPTPLRVRMALHTGACEERDGDYFGPPLNRVARLMAAGHGGQTLLSDVTQGLVRDALPTDASLRGLGEHRLKDLARPEQVFQLLHPNLPAEFPPLRSLDNPSLPNNLPQQVTSFIGRENEVTAIQNLMQKSRLMTLVGSGGAGKSRLSLQVAADLLEQFADGAWLVELAPLSDPALVPQTVAQALGVRDVAGQPIDRTLIDTLKTKNILILLDNCEHLLSACAAFASDALRACPHVHILASSREALNVAGEQTYRVPSLSLPNPQSPQTAETVSQYEAVVLFIQRAQAVQPSFAVTDANAPAVTQVCWRLDGIPLAIELAAARVRAMPVEQVMARLDDRFRLLTGGSRTALPRQQTLRALMDWSYDLLTAQEKTLLCRLSVFAGGWSLEMAERVCSGESPAGEMIENLEVLDLLMGLMDKSLVVYEEKQSGEARYRLLETVRQYARARLLEDGEAEIMSGRHLDEIARLLGETPPQERSDYADWLRRVDAEHDNVRAALDWGLTLAPGDEDHAVRVITMICLLCVFWWTRTLHAEGCAYVSAALDANPAACRSDAGVQILAFAGLMHGFEGNYAVACDLMDEFQAWSRGHGDAWVSSAFANYAAIRV